MKKAKNLKDGQYYWVKRKPFDRDGISVHPRWEPMLWEAATVSFHTRGDRNGYELGDLAAVGEIIERRPRRVTRKGYIPTMLNKKSRRAEPVYDSVHNSAKAATRAGTGLPIPVEISWAAEDQGVANAFARTVST